MSTKKMLISIIAAILIALLALLLGFLFPGITHAQSPSQNCHFLIGGSPQQACRHQKVQLSITKVGAIYQSQQIQVPTVFTFTYICDGWSPNDWYSMDDEHGSRITPTSLTCDNLLHSRIIVAHYPHKVSFRFGRPPQSSQVSF